MGLWARRDEAMEKKRFRLEYAWERKDKYGRTLAYVYLEDGTFLNAEIIRQGYGFAETRFPFKYLEEFRKLERDAREARPVTAAPECEDQRRATRPRPRQPVSPGEVDCETRKYGG